MKKWEKEILQQQIQNEMAVTSRLENIYKKSLDEINNKILALKAKDQTQSVIYQLKYQEQLQSQIKEIYSKMASTWYPTIDKYLKECYEDSFYTTMYALHQEGIPVIIPFNQEEVAQAAAQDVGIFGDKLSTKLYADVYDTAKKTVAQISKGIAMNSSYASIALDVAKTGAATANQAYRIVRTESHRIHEEVKFKTINKAKDKGADVVKQWDASIDKRTRKSHAALDGQLRELDQPFKSPTSGHTAMYPGGFGIASEDINCRCVVLQRARWALDKSEVEKAVGNLDNMTDDQLEELANKFGVSKDELIKKSNGIIESDGSINHRIKAQNYNQFKKKYKKKEKVQQAQQGAQDNVVKQGSTPSDHDALMKNAKRFTDDTEANKYHTEKNFVQDRWDNQLSADERNGIVTYTGSAYRDMNRNLRAGTPQNSHWTHEIEVATHGLEKTLIAEDCVVYRGMGGADALASWTGIPIDELKNKAVQQSLIGTRLTEKAFMSTSPTAPWGGIRLEVYLPKGAQAMYVDPISVFRGEREILVQRNSTFEVKRIDTDSNGYITNIVLVLIEQLH